MVGGFCHPDFLPVPIFFAIELIRAVFLHVNSEYQSAVRVEINVFVVLGWLLEGIMRACFPAVSANMGFVPYERVATVSRLIKPVVTCMLVKLRRREQD